MKSLIVFIGFGEAAFHIANGLKSEGLSDMIAYDMNQDHPVKGLVIRKRADEVGIPMVTSLSEALESAQFIASLTSASVALAVADSIIPQLNEGQIFIDMNSASPTIKKSIGDLPRKLGVLVCDSAIMNTVPGNGHKVQMLLSGDGAAAFYDAFSKYGMHLTDLKSSIGASSAIKMFRSVFMKGLPQLLIESMMPAAKFGVLNTLVDSLNETMVGKTMDQLAEGLLVRTIIHAERRASEMKEVILTLDNMGIDASMSTSVEKKLEQLAALRLGEEIGVDSKINYQEAIDLLIERYSVS